MITQGKIRIPRYLACASDGSYDGVYQRKEASDSIPEGKSKHEKHSIIRRQKRWTDILK